jgi:hypothetical protein
MVPASPERTLKVHLAIAAARPRRCFDGIAQQIEHDLLQLHAVAEHGGQVGCNVQIKMGAVGLGFGSRERQGLRAAPCRCRAC